MSDDDCSSESLTNTQCALEATESDQDIVKGQNVHRYVYNFHMHEGGQAVKCGNCGAQKICPRCNTTAGKHQCEVCGIFISSRPRCIQKHSRVHSGERPYKCYLCNESFKQAATLSQHHRIHLGVYPYTCDKCGNSFRQLTHLNEHHQSVHSEDRNFQCNQCSKTYKLRKYLMRHYRQQHKCGYDCIDCGDRLRTRDAYTLHHTKHVKEKAARASQPRNDKGGTFENDDEEAEASGTPII